MSHGNKIDY
jgi:hypothetical protein